MKHITEHLEIEINAEYCPNGYDDWKLYLSVNGKSYNLAPFGAPQRDLSVCQIAEYIKQAIIEELDEC